MQYRMHTSEQRDIRAGRFNADSRTPPSEGLVEMTHASSDWCTDAATTVTTSSTYRCRSMVVADRSKHLLVSFQSEG